MELSHLSPFAAAFLLIFGCISVWILSCFSLFFFIISCLWMRWVQTGCAIFRSLGYVGARTIFCINTFFFSRNKVGLLTWQRSCDRERLELLFSPQIRLQPCCPQIKVFCPCTTVSRLPRPTCSAHVAVVKWMAEMLFWGLGTASTSCSIKRELGLLFIHYLGEPSLLSLA